MTTTYMRNETKEKFKKISRSLVDRYGVEVLNYNNFKSLFQKEADKLKIPMAMETIRNYYNYIRVVILNMDKKDIFEIENEKPIENPLENEIKDEIPLEKEKIDIIYDKKEKLIKKIVIEFNDGTFDEFIKVEKIEIEKPVEKPVEEIKVKKVWEGLFDYGDGGNDEPIYIQKSYKKYRGCNIRNWNDISKHFDDYQQLMDFIYWALDKRHIPHNDSERDNETLLLLKQKVFNRIKNQTPFR